MTISGLIPDQRRPGSTRIFVDGKPIWTVPADVVGALGLGEGSRIPAEAVEALDAAADVEGALRSGMKMLGRRAHGRTELGRKLSRKGHSDATVEAALERLDNLELIDDQVFAKAYVEGRAARGRGPGRLRRDLAALGVAPGTVEVAIASLAAEEAPDPWERTLMQASRRAAHMGHLPHATRIRRLGAFFARRGFGGEQAREAVAGLASHSSGEAVSETS